MRYKITGRNINVSVRSLSVKKQEDFYVKRTK